MVEIKNLDQVIEQLDKWLFDATTLVTNAARGYSVNAFQIILEHSAQFSGDFAANWKYSLNKVDPTFQIHILGEVPVVPGEYGRLQISEKFTPFMMGSSKAISKAKQLNSGREEEFKLGDTVYISNSAEHGEPYALKIEEGSIKFREGNQGAPVQRTTDYMNHIKVIDYATAKRFAAMRIGS